MKRAEHIPFGGGSEEFLVEKERLVEIKLRPLSARQFMKGCF
jgi:hypothetical protein